MAQPSAAEATTGATVLRGSAWNFVSRLLPQLYVVIVSVVAARFLGPDGMGRQSFIAFVALSVTYLFSGGLSVSLMRYVGESFGRERPAEGAWLIRWGWRLSAAGAALGGGLLAAVAVAGADPESAWLFAAVATGFSILHTIPSAALIGAQRWRDATIVGLITGTLAVPGIIVVLAAGGGITGIFVVEAVVAAANLAFTALLARRAFARIAARPVKVPALRRATARYALWSSVTVVLTLIVFRRSEFFFLERFSSDSEIAVYSIAFATIYALSLLPEALASALFPAFATLFGAGDSQRLQRGFRRGMRLLTMITIPTAAGVFAVGPELLVLVYGADYDGTGVVLRVLVLGLPFLPLMNVSNALLVGMGLPKPMLVAGAVAAIVNVALALVLIPAYDAIGAGVANTVAQMIVALGLLVYAGRLVGERAVDFPAAARALAASLAGGAVAWLVVTPLGGVPGVALGLLAGTAVFAVAARLLAVLPADDARWLCTHTRGGRLEGAVRVGTAFLAPASGRAT